MIHVSVFQALAEPARRRIVEVLQGREQSVSEIVAQLNIRQSGVSRHLRILEEARFVQVRPLGQKRLYSLRVERFLELEAWLAKYQSFWEGRLDTFAVALSRRQKGSVVQTTTRRRRKR